MRIPFKALGYLFATVRDGFVWAVGYNVLSSMWEWLASKIKKQIK